MSGVVQRVKEEVRKKKKRTKKTKKKHRQAGDVGNPFGDENEHAWSSESESDAFSPRSPMDTSMSRGLPPSASPRLLRTGSAATPEGPTTPSPRPAPPTRVRSHSRARSNTGGGIGLMGYMDSGDEGITEDFANLTPETSKSKFSSKTIFFYTAERMNIVEDRLDEMHIMMSDMLLKHVQTRKRVDELMDTLCESTRGAEFTLSVITAKPWKVIASRDDAVVEEETDADRCCGCFGCFGY